MVVTGAVEEFARLSLPQSRSERAWSLTSSELLDPTTKRNESNRKLTVGDLTVFDIAQIKLLLIHLAFLKQRLAIGSFVSRP